MSRKKSALERTWVKWHSMHISLFYYMQINLNDLSSQTDCSVCQWTILVNKQCHMGDNTAVPVSGSNGNAGRVKNGQQRTKFLIWEILHYYNAQYSSASYILSTKRVLKMHQPTEIYILYCIKLCKTTQQNSITVFTQWPAATNSTRTYNAK